MDRDAAQDIPACPFCGAAWSDAMLQTLEAHSRGASCACCMPGARNAHVTNPLGLPAQDLCCERCGRAIYRAPAVQPR